ncbi:MAG: hypothetical protein CVU63_13125 [Deltaproteobacteria bacterium HGW-Deltaproteobacteria-20]|nr:MAG: hypothetical protein CVU63_13125 [Deltaproteobacteria bacterium HGW-Deltaproteobacteria-20]
MPLAAKPPVLLPPMPPVLLPPMPPVLVPPTPPVLSPPVPPVPPVPVPPVPPASPSSSSTRVPLHDTTKLSDRVRARNVARMMGAPIPKWVVFLLDAHRGVEATVSTRPSLQGTCLAVQAQ